ncbi:MAG: RES family NAD+ phosphorylase [Bacteroidales bacterium]|nr:RES family NAD+ phosphorylase [Bacteroidales bacterium]
MELENFPKLKDVRNSIEKLNRIGFPKFNGDIEVDIFVKKIEKTLTEEFGFLFNPIKPFKHKEFSLKIFRVRELDAITNINLIREHSYPPTGITGMGRCNFPQFPVFYCSNDAITALLEVVKNYGKSDKKYCISKWEIQSPDDELIFQTFLQTELPLENHFRLFQEELNKRINEPFEESLNIKFGKDRKEGLIEYLSFLDSSFIKDKDYSLSASLAHKSLYADHNYRTDILMYPSVQTSYKGVNFALHPNFVDNNLKLTRLYEVSLNNYNPQDGKVSVTFYKYADIKKNIFFWKKIIPNDDYNKRIEQDFGQIIDNKFIMKK